MRVTCFLCLFIGSCTWLFAQKNINQIMVDKLEDGYYWEAKKFYSYLKTTDYFRKVIEKQQIIAEAT